MDLRKYALEVLEETSRTFYIPIIRLPPGLQEAVASAYLCMRAIDEIEAHPELDNSTKAKLLRTITSRVENILTWVQRLIKFCPIGSIAVELVRFDTQLMQDAKISGIAYQQGTLVGLPDSRFFW